MEALYSELKEICFEYYSRLEVEYLDYCKCDVWLELEAMSTQLERISQSLPRRANRKTLSNIIKRLDNCNYTTFIKMARDMEETDALIRKKVAELKALMADKNEK